MRSTHLLSMLVFVLGACDPAPSPIPSGSLTPEERQLARSVPTYGDVVFVHPNGRHYVGGFGITISLGTDAGDRAGLSGNGLATGPTGSMGISFAVPLDSLRGFATDGLDLSSDLDPLLGATFGGDLNGYARHMHLRADPDGMFIATFTVDTVTGAGALDGDTVEVQVYGRMSGGCERIVEDGVPLVVVDVLSEPICADILGSF